MLADWFGRFITAPKYPDDEIPKEHYRLEDIRAHLVAGGMLIQNEGSRFVFHERDHALCLFVDGRRYHYSVEQTELVQTLCADLTINLSMYLLSDSDLQLVVDLLNHGSLYLPE